MSDMAVDFKPYKITVPEFLRMGEAGVFEDKHVELLDGILVEVSPFSSPHAYVGGRVAMYLSNALRGRADLFVPLTLPLGRYDAPEPDIAIAAPRGTEYYRRHLQPRDVYALIEIALSSLSKDTRLKRDLYARFSITDYLVADLPNSLLRHYTDPAAGRYATEERLTYGDTFSLKALPDITLDADPFLPPRE